MTHSNPLSPLKVGQVWQLSEQSLPSAKINRISDYGRWAWVRFRSNTNPDGWSSECSIHYSAVVDEDNCYHIMHSARDHDLKVLLYDPE